MKINKRQKERMKKSLIIFVKTLFTSKVFVKVYSELCKTYKMDTFAKIVNDLKLLIVFTKKLHLGCLKELKICL